MRKFLVAFAAVLAVLTGFGASAQDATAVTFPAGLEPFNFTNSVLAVAGPYLLPVAGAVIGLAFIGGIIMLAQKRTRGIASGRSR